jgi:hypothetical protein
MKQCLSRCNAAGVARLRAIALLPPKSADSGYVKTLTSIPNQIRKRTC